MLLSQLQFLVSYNCNVTTLNGKQMMFNYMWVTVNTISACWRIYSAVCGGVAILSHWLSVLLPASQWRGERPLPLTQSKVCARQKEAHTTKQAAWHFYRESGMIFFYQNCYLFSWKPCVKRLEKLLFQGKLSHNLCFFPWSIAPFL